MRLQVTDLIMAEEKPLVELSDDELDDDPLLFLSCGHTFPRSSVDGLTELQNSYGQTPAGAWEKPLPLEVRSQAILFERPFLHLPRLGYLCHVKHSVSAQMHFRLCVSIPGFCVNLE